MSQHTEVSFPPEQTQTFHTDQENKKKTKSFREEHFPPAAQLPHQKFAFTSREYSKLEREKNFTPRFLSELFITRKLLTLHTCTVWTVSALPTAPAENQHSESKRAECTMPVPQAVTAGRPGLETEKSPTSQALQAVFTEKL